MVVALSLGAISSAITIANYWRKVTSALITFFNKIWIGIKALAYAIISPAGRDVVLFLFIVGIGVWLFFVNRKLRELGFRKGSKVDEGIEWTIEHIYVLSSIVETEQGMYFEELFIDYMHKFSDSSRLDYQIIFDDLQGERLISWGMGDKGIADGLYKSTAKGRKLYKSGKLNELIENSRKEGKK